MPHEIRNMATFICILNYLVYNVLGLVNVVFNNFLQCNGCDKTWCLCLRIMVSSSTNIMSFKKILRNKKKRNQRSRMRTQALDRLPYCTEL